jgi:hypothetical protein
MRPLLRWVFHPCERTLVGIQMNQVLRSEIWHALAGKLSLSLLLWSFSLRLLLSSFQRYCSNDLLFGSRILGYTDIVWCSFVTWRVDSFFCSRIFKFRVAVVPASANGAAGEQNGAAGVQTAQPGSIFTVKNRSGSIITVKRRSGSIDTVTKTARLAFYR